MVQVTYSSPLAKPRQAATPAQPLIQGESKASKPFTVPVPRTYSPPIQGESKADSPFTTGSQTAAAGSTAPSYTTTVKPVTPPSQPDNPAAAPAQAYDLSTDPLLQQVQALSTMSRSQAEAQAAAARKQAAIQIGLPDVFGVDAATAQAASQNPFSGRQRLTDAFNQDLSALDYGKTQATQQDQQSYDQQAQDLNHQFDQFLQDQGRQQQLDSGSLVANAGNLLYGSVEHKREQQLGDAYQRANQESTYQHDTELGRAKQTLTQALADLQHNYDTQLGQRTHQFQGDTYDLGTQANSLLDQINGGLAQALANANTQDVQATQQARQSAITNALASGQTFAGYDATGNPIFKDAAPALTSADIASAVAKALGQQAGSPLASDVGLGGPAQGAGGDIAGAGYPGLLQAFLTPDANAARKRGQRGEYGPLA